LARAGGVALDLDGALLRDFETELLPAAVLLGADPRNWVLGGGEDHGLLAAFGPEAELPEGFHAVGSVRAGAPAVTVDGAVPEVLGWDHFRG
jgi:thiamine-monophosphate kinase